MPVIPETWNIDGFRGEVGIDGDAWFFWDQKELFFSFAPGFWPAKALSSLIWGEGVLPLTFNQYYYIGLGYVILLNIVTYKVFLKRTKL